MNILSLLTRILCDIDVPGTQKDDLGELNCSLFFLVEKKDLKFQKRKGLNLNAHIEGNE